MRGEFGHKTLIYMSENEAPARFGAQIRDNSLYFPGYQGIWLAETCSEETWISQCLVVRVLHEHSHFTADALQACFHLEH